MIHVFDKKVVLFLEGLGNQLFQFVFMLYLKEKQGKHVEFNASFYKNRNVHEGFQAKLVFDFSDFKESKKNLYFLYRLCRKMKFRGSTWVWGHDDNVSCGFQYPLYRGYWQNLLYFNEIKDSIKQYELDLKPYANKEFLNKIMEGKSMFVHVRRGDYLRKGSIFLDLSSTNYYHKALEVAKGYCGDANIFVFSDDIAWCRDYFSAYKNFNYIEYENQSAVSDLALMSYCDYGIIANSSFSWWGAMLNKDKIVMCPNKYYNEQLNNDHDNYECPSSWIPVDINDTSKMKENER